MLERIMGLSDDAIADIISTVAMASVSIITCIATVRASVRQSNREYRMQLRKERLSAYAELIDISNECIMLPAAVSPSPDLVRKVHAASLKAIALSPKGIADDIAILQSTILAASGARRSAKLIKECNNAQLHLIKRISETLDYDLSRPVRVMWVTRVFQEVRARFRRKQSSERSK